MENIQNFIQKNEHEKILELPSPDYNIYKAISSIYLEKYDLALLYSEKGSFEKAYAYYKLKNFKKSLKILNRLSGEKVDILKAQNLYFLGCYTEAYTLLSKYGNSDEIAVNLSAIESLDFHNKINSSKPSLFTSNGSKGYLKIVKYKFKDSECLLEGEYNLSFKKLEDERIFVHTLKELDEKFKIENSCIKKQLRNLFEEENQQLSKTESEISQFNKGLVTAIKNPVLYQGNFLNSKSSDYQIFKDYKLNKNDFIEGKKTFETYNNKLRLLKGLIIAKRKPTAERVEKIRQTISQIEENSLEKQVLELLTCDLDDENVQKRAIQIILKSSNE